ncbi:Bug family tripartite tricarboxylate transporter substrate binding protein [Chelativorans sp. YIM 93263]|uniref:Bug family tripartite tricarboxylate transporter substrate binding protein n=1 Tax=Chelativorans sp. YIM 93263 TaxID=2906648 RepID=UPI00237853FB|nr:tripartite tricarboxylate transporter substrate binding protein [Chelativorans sp. YIM 93263]
MQKLRPLALALMLGLGYGNSAQAQDWPSEPIKIIVGFSAGSSIDSVARIVGENLTKSLGQPVVVENRTGANGMLAATAVAQAESDGHTILFSNSSSITVNPTLFNDIQYQPLEDFEPVTKVVATPFILVTNPENERTAGVTDVASLVELAREKPDELSYGSAGIGNLIHIATELLSQQADVKMTHIPYKGAAPMEVGLLGGEIDLAFDTPAGVPQIEAGKLTALAVSGPDRWPGLPDTPTMMEAGYPDFDVTFWTGVFVPDGTDPAIVKALYDAIVAATEDPATREKLEMQGRPVVPTPEEFRAQIAEETEVAAQTIEAAGIVVEQ